MGNSALKSHLETSQKTGVFQLTEKGLQEVRGLLFWAETDMIVAAGRHNGLRSPSLNMWSGSGLSQQETQWQNHHSYCFGLLLTQLALIASVSRGAAAADGQPADGRPVWEQDRGSSCRCGKVPAAQESHD